MADLVYEDEVYRIRGAVFEVHSELGNGFLEAVYHECLGREFVRAGIPYVSHKNLSLSYKGESLRQTYQADMVCYDRIILELKAVNAIVPVHRAQLIHYLRLTGMKLGLIVNFGTFPKAQIERIVL